MAARIRRRMRRREAGSQATRPRVGGWAPPVLHRSYRRPLFLGANFESRGLASRALGARSRPHAAKSRRGACARRRARGQVFRAPRGCARSTRSNRSSGTVPRPGRSRRAGRRRFQARRCTRGAARHRAIHSAHSRVFLARGCCGTREGIGTRRRQGRAAIRPRRTLRNLGRGAFRLRLLRFVTSAHRLLPAPDPHS